MPVPARCAAYNPSETPRKGPKNAPRAMKKQSPPVAYGNADAVPPPRDGKQEGKSKHACQGADLGGCERIIRWSAVTTKDKTKCLAEGSEKREPDAADSVVSPPAFCCVVWAADRGSGKLRRGNLLAYRHDNHNPQHSDRHSKDLRGRQRFTQNQPADNRRDRRHRRVDQHRRSRSDIHKRLKEEQVTDDKAHKP